jgi:hypothetical protein
VSKHWNPDEELASRIAAEELARAQKRSWPEGATAGLLLVAASCLAVGALLYQFAGPRDVIEDSVARR